MIKYSEEANMLTFKKDKTVFSVDIEKTENYYKTHSLCGCKDCRNYYAQTKNKFSELDSFLSEFGVDISKPDEALSVEADGYIDYLTVYYSVCGKIESRTEYKTELFDTMPLFITIGNEYAPNEQDGDYFMISVMGIKLPFVLE